jgi:hypothetical protein
MARRLAGLVRWPIVFVAAGPFLPQPKGKAGRLTYVGKPSRLAPDRTICCPEEAIGLSPGVNGAF